MHTPGPWEFEYDGGPSGPFVFHADPTDPTNGVDICEVRYANESVKESLANARLISAAPELLECLKGLADQIDPLHEIENYPGGDLGHYLRVARHLINKATGDKRCNTQL